jgi:hypothetical protein
MFSRFSLIAHIISRFSLKVNRFGENKSRFSLNLQIVHFLNRSKTVAENTIPAGDMRAGARGGVSRFSTRKIEKGVILEKISKNKKALLCEMLVINFKESLDKENLL